MLMLLKVRSSLRFAKEKFLTWLFGFYFLAVDMITAILYDSNQSIVILTNKGIIVLLYKLQNKNLNLSKFKEINLKSSDDC